MEEKYLLQVDLDGTIWFYQSIGKTIKLTLVHGGQEKIIQIPDVTVVRIL